MVQTPNQETRRSISKKRAKIIAELEWLVEREDEEGFRRYLRSYELAEGSEEYEQAFEVWRTKLREKQSHPRLPGAFAPARSRRTSPGASR
jgi:hypothetical protein